MLTAQQIDDYRRDGFLLVPDAFSAEEVDAMQRASATVGALDVEQRVMENDGVHVRSVYAVEEFDPLFARLVRDRRTVAGAQQLLDEDVYLFQTQLNPKAPFIGDLWEWHQDYYYWQRTDNMPSPRALNVAVYLDDMTVFNGPIFFIPGSHEDDVAPEVVERRDSWQTMLTSSLPYIVPTDVLARLIDRRGLAAPLAGRGAVLFFDSRLFHSSPPNLAPYARTVLFLRYSAMSNQLLPMESPRPQWLANRRPEAIELLDDELLATSAAT